MTKELDRVIERLSPIERRVVPYLNLSIEEIVEKAGLDKTSVLRALKFLENKGLVKIKSEKKRVVELGTNGIYYRKNHLPERVLLTVLSGNRRIELDEARKLSKLSENEFRVSLGILKRKEMIGVADGKIILAASAEEMAQKTPEELFLEILPIDETDLDGEQKKIFEDLKKRKDIIIVEEKSVASFELTESGKEIAGREIKGEFLEEVTPAVIKGWKRGKKFRSYDIKSGVPAIYGGRKHFVSETVQRGKRIWLDVGFQEMSGSKVVTSFWNFDALFTAQDHPVREMHDTFFIKDIEGKLPDKKWVNEVKRAHEGKIEGSKGWSSDWKEEEAKKVLLRTHTTLLSAQTLASLNKKDLPAKYFAIGRNFRNETVDWSHGFEFNQTEGIVVDPNGNLRNLIGYLLQFAKKMGFEKIRIQPGYFPYTEPSLEGAVWHEGRKEWVEVLAAGIFRPEVTVPLLGEHIPVLAWGPGFDRLMMMAQGIKDMRKIYENDIKDLRGRKI